MAHLLMEYGRKYIDIKFCPVILYKYFNYYNICLLVGAMHRKHINRVNGKHKIMLVKMEVTFGQGQNIYILSYI